jgi:hypothetical protein
MVLEFTLVNWFPAKLCYTGITIASDISTSLVAEIQLADILIIHYAFKLGFLIDICRGLRPIAIPAPQGHGRPTACH